MKCSVQFSSVPRAIGVVGRGAGGMSDDSAEILFHSFPQEAHMNSSGMGRNVQLSDVPSSKSCGRPEYSQACIIHCHEFCFRYVYFTIH